MCDLNVTTTRIPAKVHFIHIIASYIYKLEYSSSSQECEFEHKGGFLSKLVSLFSMMMCSILNNLFRFGHLLATAFLKTWATYELQKSQVAFLLMYVICDRT